MQQSPCCDKGRRFQDVRQRASSTEEQQYDKHYGDTAGRSEPQVVGGQPRRSHGAPHQPRRGRLYYPSNSGTHAEGGPKNSRPSIGPNCCRPKPADREGRSWQCETHQFLGSRCDRWVSRASTRARPILRTTKWPLGLGSTMKRLAARTQSPRIAMSFAGRWSGSDCRNA